MNTKRRENTTISSIEPYRPGRTWEGSKRWGPKQLTKAEFALSDALNEHNLSVIACDLADRYRHYRCPHSGGAVFVAFSGAPNSVPRRCPNIPANRNAMHARARHRRA
ncbi:DUF6882 domain-containing protein [Senegalimassilia anaerobia]|uniref:DUF6882 domain-containing protein n=1 Tax=Senegalimassilia anaerobia TaxID=1473216 RepID=UPI00350E5662